jgi:excisionase family DNA binding protein
MKIPGDMIQATISLNDQYFDLQGLSLYACIPVSTLRDYMRKESLPYFKPRGKVLVKRSEFDKWLETYRVDRSVRLNEIINDVLRKFR